jgi:hypothetical protein
MRLAAAFLWAFAGFALGLAIVGAPWLQAHDPTPGDDGWRRTTSGWERVELWGVPARPTPPDRLQVKPPATTIRWDFHPALLVFGQVALVWAAFWLCRATKRASASPARL